MALLIHIKKGKKVIINGAVLENASGRTMSFLLQNEAQVLRGDDVLAPDDASTPAGRIYYALQCLYLFPERQPRYLPLFSDLIECYRQASPSASDLIDTILESVRAGRFYEALKGARELIRHEGRLLTALAEAPAAKAAHDHEMVPDGPDMPRRQEHALVETV